MIEAAFVLPLALALVIGIMEFSIAIWTEITLVRATDSAARCGAINKTLCGSAVDIQNYAIGVANALGVQTTSANFPTSNIVIGQPCPSSLTATPAVRVQATYSLNLKVLWFLNQQITYTPAACFPKHS